MEWTFIQGKKLMTEVFLELPWKFYHLLSLVKIYLQILLSCINDYPENMVIFTTSTKIYSTEY